MWVLVSKKKNNVGSFCHQGVMICLQHIPFGTEPIKKEEERLWKYPFMRKCLLEIWKSQQYPRLLTFLFSSLFFFWLNHEKFSSQKQF